MTADEAIDMMDDLLAYYGWKMPKAAQKHWCQGLMKFSVAAAEKGITDVFDHSSPGRRPSRSDVMMACWRRQQEMFPTITEFDRPLDKWEEDLARAVFPHCMRYLQRRDTMQQWANNFRAVARQQGVEDKIDWSAWEQIGAEFYV